MHLYIYIYIKNIFVVCKLFSLDCLFHIKVKILLNFDYVNANEVQAEVIIFCFKITCKRELIQIYGILLK
jgi:hypothetical protein